jgi:hypothetical protein
VFDDVAVIEGDLAASDRLLLMTDALAQWFLVESEMGRRPWAALAKIGTPEQFTAFIDCLRAGARCGTTTSRW